MKLFSAVMFIGCLMSTASFAQAKKLIPPPQPPLPAIEIPNPPPPPPPPLPKIVLPPLPPPAPLHHKMQLDSGMK